jgi:hypothetical protein
MATQGLYERGRFERVPLEREATGMLFDCAENLRKPREHTQTGNCAMRAVLPVANGTGTGALRLLFLLSLILAMKIRHPD